MIDIALRLIQIELADFLKKKNDPATVVVDNIGLFETSDGSSLKNNIVITLVNVEEESTLKNSPALRRPFNITAVYQNPPVFLNLYVLFTSNYSGNDYLQALQRLSWVIQFLQSKNSFSSASTSSVTGIELPPELKFTLELYTLTFEQINHLWGSLGGRQMPFAMYKLRLVGITESAVVREVPLIEEIETNKYPIHN